MLNLVREIKRHAACIGDKPPKFNSASFKEKLGIDHMEVISNVNGFISRNNAFRFYGTDTLCGLVDIESLNNLDAFVHYKMINGDFISFAEDVYGDQYCYRNGSSKVFKLYCEGGSTTDLDTNIVNFLLDSVLLDHPNAYDVELADTAFAKGLIPNPNEHLSFQIPLIVNGSYDISNICIESRELHLGTLGQMSMLSNELEDGQKIDKFVDHS